MAVLKITRPVVEKPFLQQRYLEKMAQDLRKCQMDLIAEGKEIPELDRLLHMTGVLIEQDYSQMERDLPPAYYAIMGHVGQIGKTSDPDDMWAEEPHCWIRPLTKEEFDNDDD
ncbi:hypothetical protein D3C76_935350 [compost metagenome]